MKELPKGGTGVIVKNSSPSTTLSQLSADSWPTDDRQLADRRPTVDRRWRRAVLRNYPSGAWAKYNIGQRTGNMGQWNYSIYELASTGIIVYLLCAYGVKENWHRVVECLGCVITDWSFISPQVFEVKRQMRSVSDVGSQATSAAYSNGSAVPALDRERNDNAVVV